VPDGDQSTVLELYKNAVEMADRVSSRRAGANTFFLTLNTTLAAVVGIVSSARKPSSHGSVPSFDAFGLVLTAVAGIVLAIVWRALLAYYRRLNHAKFDVINKLEEQLPAQPYAEEWEILHPNEPDEPDTKLEWWQLVKRLRRWRRRTRHREATVIEQVVPLVFVAIYVALAARVLVE
jgi:hypothetical protein